MSTKSNLTISGYILAIFFSTANAGMYNCEGFNDEWYTTTDGCPVIKKTKAFSKSIDSTATHCTYSAVIGNVSYSQYDSAQSLNETSVLIKYGHFLSDAEQKFDDCVWQTDLANDKLLSKCIKSFKKQEDGRKWCNCKYGAIKSLSIPYSRSSEFSDENSALYGQTYNCFVTGDPVKDQQIRFDTSQIVIPAYRSGKVMNVNIPISGYLYSFLFDTGADRVLINKKVLKRLADDNNLMIDSAKTGKFEIATGKIVSLPLIRIKQISIGDVVLTDIAAAVQDDSTSSMLFGMSGISKFKSWTMHENPLQIILHK